MTPNFGLGKALPFVMMNAFCLGYSFGSGITRKDIYLMAVFCTLPRAVEELVIAEGLNAQAEQILLRIFV